jgi:multiple sugar transport system permease protein
MRRSRAMKYAFIVPSVLWILVVSLYPLIRALYYSFHTYVLGKGITAFVGFQNYLDNFQNPTFWHSAWITLVYVAVAIGVETVLGVALAWAVGKRIWGQHLFRMLFTAPLFTTEVAVGYLGVTLFDADNGPANYFLSFLPFHPHPPWLTTAFWGLAPAILLDVWQWTPFIFLVALAGFQGVPGEFYEAASLDSAAEWPVFRAVALPAIAPVLTIAILLRLMEALKVFGLPYALTSGGPGASTQVYSTMVFLTTIQFFDFGHGSAMGILFLVAVLALVLRLFRVMRRQIE